MEEYGSGVAVERTVAPAGAGAGYMTRLSVRSSGRVFFLKGRLRFVGAKHPAPFASALVFYLPPS